MEKIIYFKLVDSEMTAFLATKHISFPQRRFIFYLKIFEPNVVGYILKRLK